LKIEILIKLEPLITCVLVVESYAVMFLLKNYLYLEMK